MGRNHLHSHAIFELPLSFEAHEALVDVSGHIGVDMERKVFDSTLIDPLVDLSLQLVGEQDAGLDFARSIASGTSLLHIHVHRRSYPLPGDLH